MTIQSASERIIQLVTTYKSRLDQISQNEGLSEEYKKRGMNQLNQESLPAIESAVKRLWGDMIELPSGRYTLDGAGEVWSVMDSAEQRLFNGRQAFLDARYKNIALMEIYAARVNTAIRRSMTGDDFLKLYESMAIDERTYTQDHLDTLFSGKDSHDWRRAKLKIAADLKTDEDAALNPLQAVINNAVTDAFKIALPAGRFASNTPLALLSQYLNQWQKGVYTKHTPQYLEVSRQEWGAGNVQFANADKFYKVEASEKEAAFLRPSRRNSR